MMILRTSALATLLLTSLLCNGLAAQRPNPRPQPSAPSAPSPAPRPSAGPSSAPRPSVSPAPSAPRPSVSPAPRPSVTPTPRPSAQPTPRPSVPQVSRPTPAPRPTYTPPAQPYNPQPSPSPSNSGSRPRPTYTPTPRPSTNGGIRTPGATKPNSGSSSTPTADPATPGGPRSRPSSSNPPRAVGGGVRVVDRYTPATAPKPRPGNGGVVDGGGNGSNGSNSDGRPAGGAQVRPRNPGLSARPTPTRTPVTTPQLVDRYVPGRPANGRPTNGGPRDVLAPRPNPRPQPPTVSPVRPTASRPLSLAQTPNLVVRPRSTNTLLGGATRHWYGGSCYGPAWSPVRSWGYWNPYCSSSLGFYVGYGSSPFCWGWNSWYPWRCSLARSRWYSGFGWCWYSPWYSSCATPIWWMPTSYCSPWYYQTSIVYASAPSRVVVVDRPVDDVVVVGGALDLTPEEQGRRWVDFGDYYFAEGRYRDALDAYAKARSLLPKDASLHFVMADAAFALGDWHFAAFLIGEALRLEPGLAGATTDKRMLYREPKAFEEQLDALRSYLATKPYDAMAHLVLGYNLKFSGQPEAAQRAFERVLEIDPANTSAMLFLDAVREERADKKSKLDALAVPPGDSPK